MKAIIDNKTIIDEFCSARRERKPWLGKGVVTNIDAFFTMQEFEALVNQTGIWSPDKLQVVLDHQPIPPQNLFQSHQAHSGPKYEINTAVLQEAIARGSSLVLNDICGLSAGIMRIREGLADIISGKIDCNLYFSQKDHQAFPIHYDVHDVIAFQIEGTKHWQVFEQAIPYPINHPAFKSRKQMNPEASRKSPLLDFEFEPGDLVYIPSGYFHHATSRKGVSIHLAYGLIEMIGMDVISMAFERAMFDEFFRTPINSILREKDPFDFYLRKWSKKIKELSNDKEFKIQVEKNLASFGYKADKISFK